ESRAVVLPRAQNPNPPTASGATKPIQSATDEYCDLLLKNANEALVDKDKANQDRTSLVQRAREAHVFVHVLNRVLRGESPVAQGVREEILRHSTSMSRWKLPSMMKR